MIRSVVGPVVRPVVSLIGELRRRGVPAVVGDILSTARILVDWSDAANNDGKFAVNENAPGTPSGNLIAFPTGMMTNESGGSTPPRTRFYSGLPDPSGVTNNAMRMLSTAANQIHYFYRSSLGHSLPAGVMTLRLRARALPGTGPHACYFGWASGYNTSGSIVDLDWTNPANEAATTLTTTFTYSGTGDIALRILASGADVLIDRLQCYPGALADMPDWADEVFTMGRPAFAYSGALPAGTGGTVDINSRPSGMLLVDPAFPAGHTYSQYTIINFGSIDDISGGAGHIMNSHKLYNGDTTGNILYLEGTAPYSGEVNTFPSGSRNSMGINPDLGGLFAIGQTRKVGERRVFFDSIPTLLDGSTVSAPPFTTGIWSVGSYSNVELADMRASVAKGKYAISAVWDTALTPAEYAEAIEAMRTRLVGRSAPMLNFTDFHVISGDSNSTRADGDWTQLVTAKDFHLPDRNMLSMVTSVGGQGIDNIDGTGNRFDLNDGPALLRSTDNGRTAFYHLCIGTNDWDILDAHPGTTDDQAAAYQVRLKELIQRALDLSPRVNVIWYSLLPQTSTSRPNWEAQRLKINADMRVWIAATSRVHICDVGGSATIGSRATQAGGGGTYYLSDEIHLTPAGDVEFASIQKSALSAARLAAGV